MTSWMHSASTSGSSTSGLPTSGSSTPAPELQQTTEPSRLTWALSLPLVVLIRGYQLLISPLLPSSCRYYPSCSAYALESVRRFGPVVGAWLAARRLLHCHPWTAGGVDHVPPRGARGLPDWEAHRRATHAREARLDPALEDGTTYVAPDEAELRSSDIIGGQRSRPRGMH